MATKRNPKQEAKAAAKKALAAAAKKQAAVDAKAATAEKKAEKAQKKTVATKEKAVSGAKPSAPSRWSGRQDTGATFLASDQVSKEKDPKPVKRHRWLLWTAAVIVALLVIAGAGFSWDRWLRYDDVADFQGDWFITGSEKAVAIDNAAINLTDDVAFSYQIDPVAKTISFSFGNKANTGRYRFSADRKQLVVVEGNSYTTLSTLLEDIASTWESLARGARGESPAQPEAGNGTTVFQREKGAPALPTTETPAVEAPAVSEPSATPPTDAGKGVDTPAAPTPDEQKNAAEPEKPTEQPSGLSSPPGTMFDDVVDQ